MASLATITRRLTNLSLQSISNTSTFTTTTSTFSSSSISSSICINSSIRSFSTKDDNKTTKEWNKWQQSLINTDPSSKAVKKTRGGKTLRKKRDAAAQTDTSLSSQARLLDGAGPGQFPPLRYNDEETEKLLQEAYANLPQKGGKRGTRKLKREKNRYHGIRKARSLKKMEKINHHFDRMEKRSIQSASIRKVRELAIEVRVDDKAYQMQILKTLAEMNSVVVGAGAGAAAIEDKEGAEISASK
jgi:hypothetical protein